MVSALNEADQRELLSLLLRLQDGARALLASR
jgi:hypothetical protein